jgi:uncharacterized metal-binding protein
MGACCSNGTRLVYSCSGAADVGEIADRVARMMIKKGDAKSTCLAAIGAHVPGFVISAQNADENLCLDGCSMLCARKTLEHIGVTPRSYVLTEMGLEKGKTAVTDEVIKRIYNCISKDQVTSASSPKKEKKEGTCNCGTC